MSYILDALEKSEKERVKGLTPTLHTIHPPVPTSSEKTLEKRVFFFALILTLSVFITATIYWSKKHTSNLTSAEKNTQHTSHVAQQEHALSIDDSNTLSSPPAPAPSDQSKLEAKQQQTSIIINPLVMVEQAQWNGSFPSGPIKPIENTPIPYAELPDYLKQTIPDLNLSAHSYSELPEKRLILVNDQILREGHYLEKNLKLKKITRNGVIFSYNGVEFFTSAE